MRTHEEVSVVALKNKNRIRSQITGGDVFRGFKISCLDSTAKTKMQKGVKKKKPRKDGKCRQRKSNKSTRETYPVRRLV